MHCRKLFNVCSYWCKIVFWVSGVNANTDLGIQALGIYWNRGTATIYFDNQLVLSHYYYSYILDRWEFMWIIFHCIWQIKFMANILINSVECMLDCVSISTMYELSNNDMYSKSTKGYMSVNLYYVRALCYDDVKLP